jgi:hypothetical protein
MAPEVTASHWRTNFRHVRPEIDSAESQRVGALEDFRLMRGRNLQVHLPRQIGKSWNKRLRNALLGEGILGLGLILSLLESLVQVTNACKAEKKNDQANGNDIQKWSASVWVCWARTSEEGQEKCEKNRSVQWIPFAVALPAKSPGVWWGYLSVRTYELVPAFWSDSSASSHPGEPLSRSSRSWLARVVIGSFCRLASW